MMSSSKTRAFSGAKEISQSAEGALSKAVPAFAESLHPLFAELGCNGCHVPGGSAAPPFAAPDPMQSLSSLIETSKLDLKFPRKSRLYQKVALSKHNCGDCDKAGRRIATAIQSWLDAGGSALDQGLGGGSPTSTIWWRDIRDSIAASNDEAIIVLDTEAAEVRAPMQLYRTAAGTTYAATKASDGGVERIKDAAAQLPTIPTDLEFGMIHFEFTARTEPIEVGIYALARCSNQSSDSFYVQLNSDMPIRSSNLATSRNVEFEFKQMIGPKVLLAAGVNQLRIYHRRTDCWLRSVYLVTAEAAAQITPQDKSILMDAHYSEQVGHQLDYDVSSLMGLGPDEVRLQAKLRPLTETSWKIFGLRIKATGLTHAIRIKDLRLCLVDDSHEDCPDNLTTFKSVDQQIDRGDHTTELSEAALIVTKPATIDDLGFLFKGRFTVID